MSALRRVLFSGAAAVMVALAAAAGPQPAQAQTCYDCGAYRGEECAATKACVWVGWARICTIKTLRYPAREDDPPSTIGGPWMQPS